MRRFLAAMLLCVVVPAQAQDPKGFLDLPKGTTLMALSTEIKKDIEQDLLIATMRYEMETDNPSALQEAINRKMQKAVEVAKRASSVKVSTEQYNVYQYEPHPRADAPVKVWHGSQSLRLESQDADAILSLIGDLQEMGLVLSDQRYQVSTTLFDSTKDSLLEEALAKLESTANRAARALGRSDAVLKQISIDTLANQSQTSMMVRSMAAKDSYEFAPPIATPGDTQISLTVSAHALLQ